MIFLNRRIIRDKQRIKRFRMMLSAFFICLLIPIVLIVYYGFQQFENEMSFNYHWKSFNALEQINKKLDKRLKKERKRPPSQYSFYQYVTNPLTGAISKELSPLASPDNYPEDIGLIGYFQINSMGGLESPLLPYQTRKKMAHAKTLLQWQEIERRFVVKDKIANILIENNFLLDPSHVAVNQQEQQKGQPIFTKVESFQLKASDSKKLIFFRHIWQDQQHKIQGFIVEQEEYLHKILTYKFLQAHYENSVQMRLKSIIPGKDNDTYQYFKYTINGKGNSLVESLAHPIIALEKQHIYHGHLITPFQQLHLNFTTSKFPLGTATEFVGYFLIILIVVIIAGCLGLYWVGIKQIALAQQRMNFVSSVSHELKTPLTAILMYSEMLKSNMVKNSETQLEYHQFIYGESSRLSRLINNILKLSNLNRQQETVNVEYVSILSLQDTIQSKVSSLIEKNGFKINFNTAPALKDSTEMLVDLDAFAQIVINLVDNSVKFFNAAKIDNEQRQQIDITFSLDKQSENKLLFCVRDYGPGISNAEHERVFELFYREGNEMTRTTPGTGIGLALVNELVMAQGGQINVKRQEPGIMFEIIFSYRDGGS